jgi:Cyclin-dependent kinase inhibitor 3 (CDKN3)
LQPEARLLLLRVKGTMTVFWVNPGANGRLAIVPRPRGNEWLRDDLEAIRDNGIDILVSLLTRPEASELGLAHEQTLCEMVGIEFRSFPITDRSVPDSHRELYALAEDLATERRHGKNIGAHCRVGIGRSSLLLAAVLCVEGLSPEHAFRLISNGRGLRVPDTPEQAEWLAAFASALPRC